MGDHRATVKMEFSMHGHEAKHEMWINWTPDGGDYDIDRRVGEWFAAQAAIARSIFDEQQWQAGEAQRKRDADERERAEFARLKAKFDPPQSTSG